MSDFGIGQGIRASHIQHAKSFQNKPAFNLPILEPNEDTIQFHAETTKKVNLAKDIAKTTGIDSNKALSMVNKFYNSDKFHEITQDSYFGFVNEATGTPLSEGEAILYLNYKLEEPYELYGETLLKDISVSQLVPYLEKGLSAKHAAYFIKNCSDENILEKYCSYMNALNGRFILSLHPSVVGKFILNLAADDGDFELFKNSDNLTENILILRTIDSESLYEGEFSKEDKKEIINHFFWQKQNSKDAQLEESIDLIRKNKNADDKTPDYIFYVLNSKFHIDFNSAEKLSDDETISKNLDKVTFLISRDENNKPNSKTYRILSPQEAIYAVKYKLNSKQIKKFVTYIDCKGLDEKEAAKKAKSNS